MRTIQKQVARVVIEPVDLTVSPESAVVSFANATMPAMLESSASNSTYGRFSVYACAPAASFEHAVEQDGCPIRRLDEHIRGFPQLRHEDAELPFLGGWIGFLSYEAGLAIERLPAAPRRGGGPIPLTHFHLYDAAAIYDHGQERWYLTAVNWPRPLSDRRPSVAARLSALYERLLIASRWDAVESADVPSSTPPRSGVSPDEYYDAVGCILRYIEAGDIYQANMTLQFTATTDASPLALYRRLRRVSPSSHAAFLPWDRLAILSSSPELFLSLRHGRVLTRPIKGTRPRSDDPELDACYRRDLIDSAKDRAELTMIVDLLRNDLGRVCRFGSVQVSEPSRIEAHPTVYHQVATIRGELAENRNWVDLLRAAYPGGSITGAPKIRAMQIIAELEPVRRGIYCGSIGMIGLDGSMSLNIAIRTMVQINNEVQFGAGGAIVSDSDPQEEYDELLTKARGMMQALGCHEGRMSKI